MVAKTFAQTLRAFARRQPFKPFVVELINGERVKVEHPEALVYRGNIAVHISPKSGISIFDHEGVAQVTDARNAVASA